MKFFLKLKNMAVYQLLTLLLVVLRHLLMQLL